MPIDQCPKPQEEIEYMARVPYANAVDSIIYVMVYTRPDISHVLGVLSRYMVTPEKKHWIVVIPSFTTIITPS